MTTELPANPESREESYLAKIAGQNVELPEKPLSRKEQYLAYIAENGASVGYGGKNLEDEYSIEELSTKVQSGDFSGINIGDYITKTVKVGANTEREEDFVVADIDYWYGIGDIELTTHHLLMIPKNGFYEPMKMNDTNTTAGGYYGSQAHGIATVAYTAGTGGTLTKQVADYTTFIESNLGENDGSYVFTYNASGKWEYDGAEVGDNLNTYGITYTGTPVEGDKLTLTFAKGYLELYRQAIYDAFGDSHILKHRSYQTTSTSSSEWHNARVELMNECMVYGCKIFANNNYGEMVAPIQLPYFSMTPNARLAHRGKGGSRYGAWLSSMSNNSNFCIANAYGLATNIPASGAFVVRPYFLFA